jgi:hypothetical protein
LTPYITDNNFSEQHISYDKVLAFKLFVGFSDGTREFDPDMHQVATLSG